MQGYVWYDKTSDQQNPGWVLTKCDEDAYQTILDETDKDAELAARQEAADYLRCDLSEIGVVDADRADSEPYIPEEL